MAPRALEKPHPSATNFLTLLKSPAISFNLFLYVELPPTFV